MEREREVRQRGSAIIGVLFFILIASILLMGIGMYCVSHQSRVQVDARYASALDIAEAGVNYEFNKISLNASQADQYPGNSYMLGGRKYRVYCTNQDGSTPWAAPKKLYVITTGTVDEVSRTVRASGKGYADGNYALFAISEGEVEGSGVRIVGNVGTNGPLNFEGHPAVTGVISFNGPGAGWDGSPPGGYAVVRKPKPVVWPTVEQIANARFPSGGMAYLARHNDNGMAIPPITGSAITKSITLYGKPGGANYYVKDVHLEGNKTITLDNTNGPINVWTREFEIEDNTSAIAVSMDPAKITHIFATEEIEIGGDAKSGKKPNSGRVDAVLYAYSSSGEGEVEVEGNAIINGRIVGAETELEGNVTINFVPGEITPASIEYYGYDSSWEELNPR